MYNSLRKNKIVKDKLGKRCKRPHTEDYGALLREIKDPNLK